LASSRDNPAYASFEKYGVPRRSLGVIAMTAYRMLNVVVLLAISAFLATPQSPCRPPS
jgi:hypothetical protein